MMWGCERIKTRDENEVCQELPLTPQAGNSLAIVACGCFWKPQLRFKRMNGVTRCVVGYSGGIEPNPNYGNIKDFTESLLMEFDPNEVSFEAILEEWSQMDYPYVKDKTQYRSALFFVDADQQQVAQRFVKKIEDKAEGKMVYIDIEPVTKFYQAEDYHQDFLAKRGG